MAIVAGIAARAAVARRRPAIVGTISGGYRQRPVLFAVRWAVVYDCTESMADFVLNPRRAPRAPVRCRAEVTAANGARWATETEDVGPRGCQIVAPHRLPSGEPLTMVIASEGMTRTLRAGGKVAWISPAEPWRLGVAFAEQDAAVAADWYEALVAKNPALAAYRGVPERISVDATVFLGAPPRLVMDFTHDEIMILRCIGSGVSVGELKQRLRDIWGGAVHALFSLIVRRHLVLSRGASVLPAAWKQILSDLEATLAVEELERPSPRAPPPSPPPPPRAPAPALHGAGTPFPRAMPFQPAAHASVHPVAPTPAPVQASGAAARTVDPGGSWGAPQEPHRDFKGAGVGWRSQSRPRSPEADQLFRQATLDAEAGKVDSAIGQLRKALHLSPGDPEIAALLGRLAFRDRSAPQK